MGIFSKERTGGELRLADYKNIWTKFCFLDESGTLDNRTQPLFTIGIIKCSEPFYLAGKVTYLRSKANFRDELKFNKLSAHNVGFAKAALDVFFNTPSVDFSSYTIDKQGDYFNATYSENHWQAYEDISIRVLESAIAPNEIVIAIADYVSTPRDIKFEVNVKKRINTRLKRLAVEGVCRFNSKANDLLQLTDLIIGAITYDLKKELGFIPEGDTHKLEFVRHLKANIGIESFMHGFRNHNINIFVDKSMLDRLPVRGENEKGLSS